jgi:curved DNA-binding protein CbpA
MAESFYELLGIDADADEGEIKEAYRERLKETHPDVNDDPDADARTKRLLEAKETLLDPAERARYDRLGHEAYVGAKQSSGQATGANGHGSTAGGPGSDGGDRRDRRGDRDSGPTNDRAGPWERRSREQRARDRVETNASWVGRHDAGWANDATENDGTGVSEGGQTAAADASNPWSSSRVDVSVDPEDVRNRGSWLSIQESSATALSAWLLYPILLGGSVFPPFPLWANVIVATCTIGVIAALQSMPGLGLAVFGTWSVLGTFILGFAGISPFSVIGGFVLATTWFPLGLTLLTAWILRT